MDPVDDPEVAGPINDSESCSGCSEDPEGHYFSQDEAYYGETESDTEVCEGPKTPHVLDHEPHDPYKQDPESSFSDCSQDDSDTHFGAPNEDPPLAESYSQDPGSHCSSPLSISACKLQNHTEQEPSVSGSNSPDPTATSPQPRNQLAREHLDCLESESEEEEGGGGCEGGGGEEGGGEREAAPPALCVSAGIQTPGAEQAEQWGAASLTETTRASRQRSRQRLRRTEGQSEKYLKEAKSKSKCIALLLTATPNSENKGVLMFRERRQRVRKFTLVSYGTAKPADKSFKDKYRFEDGRAGQDLRFGYPATSESELEEDYSFNAQGHGTALNFNYDCNPKEQISTNYYWEDMDQLPETRGKGVLMFAQRRQRMDELAAEQEEMRSKSIPVEAFGEPELAIPSQPFPQEEVAPVYQDIQDRQQLQYQEQQYQQQMFQQPNTGMNGSWMGLDPHQVSSQSKSLVANRTARPFAGGQAPAPFSPVRGVPSPTAKKPDNIFKVSVPVNTSPQVWSPTGDIIASRDERIAVPAIKTGILPEAKKRGTNKTNSKEPAEEDYMSLGAEACNFLQAPTVRQKNPPPVLPKPTIDPSCPPWSAEGRASRSPVPVSSPVPGQMHSAPLQQQWAPPHPQVATKPWAPSPTQPVPQQHMSAWAATNSPATYQPSWASEPYQAPLSIQTPTTSHVAPSMSKVPWTKLQNDTHSVASCPPQRGSTYFHASKAPRASPRLQTSEGELTGGSKNKGKGAELFARRQSRMEKFVVDAETVQANKARAPSPTFSVPATWKFSPNVRAPPPVSYNPIVSPSYPLAAQKPSPPAVSPKPKSKTNKQHPTPTPKHLSVVDVMKHQPYQLDSSLFTYNSIPEMKVGSPVPPPESKPTPVNTPTYLQARSFGHYQPTSPVPSTGSAQSFKQDAAKPSGPIFSRSRSMSLPRSPSFHSTRVPLERHLSWVENPPSPREAAVRSPLVVVDDPFGPQHTQHSFNSAAHRRSLPEPSLEWKRQVSNDATGNPQYTPPALTITSPTKASAPGLEKPIMYGPPFKSAQSLTPSNRYTGTSSLPRNFSTHSNYGPPHRVSWKF